MESTGWRPISYVSPKRVLNEFMASSDEAWAYQCKNKEERERMYSSYTYHSRTLPVGVKRKGDSLILVKE